MNKLIPTRRTWQQPWSYKEAFIIPIALLCVAISVELIMHTHAPTICFPHNVVLLIIIINSIVFAHAQRNKITIFRWLSSIPASIGAVTLFLSLSLIMALVPQQIQAQKFVFIYSVTSSWAYYVSTAYLLFIIGLVSIRRIKPMNKKNFGFALNHIGLWITIAAATFGAGDIKKYTLAVHEGHTEWRAKDNAMNIVELPFAIQLKKFHIEEYPSKIGLINTQTGDFIKNKRKKIVFNADSNSAIRYRHYSITIQQYLAQAMKFGDDYFPISDIGDTQAYFIHIHDNKNDTSYSGWIGAASIAQIPTYIDLPDSISVVALQAEAKKFSSDIKIYTPQQQIIDTVVEVNKPITCNSYKIYQTSYDERMGKWSDYSVFELVKDPWLPYVYSGIILMILGAFYIIWFGKHYQRN